MAEPDRELDRVLRDYLRYMFDFEARRMARWEKLETEPPPAPSVSGVQPVSTWRPDEQDEKKSA